MLPFGSDRPSRLKPPRVAFSCVLLLCLGLLGACSKPQAKHASVTAAATLTPSAHAVDVAHQFFALWQQGHYAQMYPLLSATSQKQIDQQHFADRYAGIADEATITATTIDFPEPDQRDAASYPFSVTYTTALFGPITEDNVLPLVREGGWRVEWSPALIFKELTGDQLIHLALTVPKRGSILDRNGKPLATEGTVPTVGTSKTLMQSPQDVPDPAATIATLSQKLGIAADQIQAKLNDPNTPSDFFIPLKTLPYNSPPDLRTQLEQAPGVLIQDTERRIYPQGKLAAQTVGYVAPITADELKKMRADGYQEGDFVGQTGLEASFEATLAGKPDARLQVVGRDGQVQAELAHKAGVAAQDIVTSLDIHTEQAAEAALGTRAGSVVAIDPRDNSVLALASVPSFDPNDFVAGLSDQQLQQLQNDPNHPFLDRPLLATYPPGSTFKVITAAAGIDYGGFTPTTTLPCTPVWYGLGQNNPKKNWTTDDNEPLTIAEGLMRSCDPVFYQIGLTLDHRDPNILPAEASGFGVGKPTGINGLQEASGVDPSPDWKQQTQHEAWFSGDSVNMSIGQGFVLMTPLQIANMFSAIAANGDLRSPVLVLATRPAGTQGPATQQFTAKTLGKLPASPTALNVIHQGMTMVVQDPRGTAYSVFAGSGLDAAGKSGTAEDVGKQNNVLFAAYAPRSAAQAVVLTVFDQGELGSAEAGPITRDVLKAILRR
jgi:penicillin-binding protein 2